jgi:Na+/melibiose symporter-like transporter
MDDPLEEQHLLDDLDDARISLQAYKRWVRIFAAFLVFFLALIALGVYAGFEGSLHHIDTAGWAATSITIGCIGAVGIIIATVVVFDSIVGDHHPDVELKKAQRAHRDYIVRQSL